MVNSNTSPNSNPCAKIPTEVPRSATGVEWLEKSNNVYHCHPATYQVIHAFVSSFVVTTSSSVTHNGLVCRGRIIHWVPDVRKQPQNKDETGKRGGIHRLWVYRGFYFVWSPVIVGRKCTLPHTNWNKLTTHPSTHSHTYGPTYRPTYTRMITLRGFWCSWN